MLHQAAIPSVQRSVADPLSTNRANITATLNFWRVAAKQRFVVLSLPLLLQSTAPKTEQMPRVRGDAFSAHE